METPLPVNPIGGVPQMTPIVRSPRGYRRIFIFLAVALIVVFGFFWWRAGFTFDFSRFFAAESAVVQLNTSATSVASGESVTLTWDASGASSCVATSTPANTSWIGDWNFSLPHGQVTIANLQQPTTFQLECQPGDGTFNVNSVFVDVTGWTTRPTCNNDGICDSSVGETTVTCPSDCQVTEPPGRSGCVAGDTVTGYVYGDGTATVTNNSTDACDIGLASYVVTQPDDRLDGQTVFASTTRRLSPGQTIGRSSLSVSYPDCRSQLDLFIGTSPAVPPYYTGSNLISYVYRGTGLCGSVGTGTPTPTPTSTSSPTLTPTPTVTPTPTGNLPVCSPASQRVEVGKPVTVVGSGGSTRSYLWYAPGSAPASGGGPSFIALYNISGRKTITMTSRGDQAVCEVIVESATPTPTPSLSPTPTPSGSATPTPTTSTTPTPSVTVSPSPSTSPSTVPSLTLQKMVRNVTQGSSEGDGANANPTETVEFSLRVSSVGTGAASGVTVRDALPAGLSFVPGSTTIDGVPASDGIVSTGLNLGSMAPGRTITVRFRATAAVASFFASGTTVLTNIGYVRGSNVPEVSDVAFVTIVNAPQNLTMFLVKMGRNVTRGETGERTPVNASPGQTIEFIIRVRNTSSVALTNVMLRDIVPTGITAIPGSVRLGGVSASDALFGAGLNLGTLAVGQEVSVVFSGRVAASSELPAGTTTLINTVQATATGVGMLTAQLPIIITNSTVVVPPVETGPGESTVLALIISGIITLLYVGYTGTDTYRRHEVGELAKEANNDPFNFNAK